MLTPSFPCIWQSPDRESLRVAIARCIHLLQREHGVTLAEIAHAAGCNAETIRNAYRREATLGLEFFSNLRFYFRETPHCFMPWAQLVDPDSACDPAPSARERLEAAREEIRRALAALEREANEMAARQAA